MKDKNKKRLGYMVTMFPRLSETFILGEILELEKLGFSITVFTRKPLINNPVHGDLSQVKNKVIELGVEGFGKWIPTFWDNLIVLLIRPRGYIKAFKLAVKKRMGSVMRKFFIGTRVARNLVKRDIPHIHAHFAADNAKIAYFASIITGKDFSFTAHAKDIWVKSTPSSLKKLLEAAKFAVTICKYNLDYLTSLTSQPEKLHLVYNGINREKFNLSTRVKKNRKDWFELIAVGRLVPKKGLNILIEACKQLREKKVKFRCRLVGDGELYAELSTSILKNDLQDLVFLEGPCSQELLIEKFLSQADILVMPCVVTPDGDRDGIPTVILEAMFMGIPVVTTPIAGIPEIIEHHKTGILVEPGSSEDLAKGIYSLIQEGKLHKRISSQGLAKVSEIFDGKKNVKQLAQLFMGK